MIENTISHMCKSARAMGLPKNKWLQVENHISVILRSSGPEYLIKFLKELKDAKVAELTGQPVELSWHKVNAKGTPAGWQSLLWNFRKPKTSIQVLGAMINSIELTALSQQQRLKWESAVRSPVRDDNPNLTPEQKSIFMEELATMVFMASVNLSRNVSKMEMFDLTDVTGTSIPAFMSSINLEKARKKGEEAHLVATGAAYIASINTAPAFAGKLVMDNMRYVYQRRGTQNALVDTINFQLAKGVYETGQHKKFYPDQNDLSTPRLHGGDLVGQIAFLQQPGGKLRTIANPNRYLNYALRPLQKAMADVVNEQTAVVVTDQRAGIIWAQEKLQQGITLHSCDLSSATDLLDIEMFGDMITDIVDNHRLSGHMMQLFEQNFQAFLHASDSEWYSPGLDKLVQWETGQPLGLAPSFATLTWMNYLAGYTAAVVSGLDPSDSFRVVGDDLICDERMAKAYSNIIRSFNGLNNPDKELVSSSYGEFCSQLITANSSFALKPKIRGYTEAYFIDLERGVPQGYFVPKRFRELGDFLAEWTSSDLDNLPSVARSSSPRPFNDRMSASLYLDVLAQVTPAEKPPREAALGPILNRAIQAEHWGEAIANMLMGDIPALGTSSVRTKVNNPVKYRYVWSSDQRVVDKSNITMARDIKRRIEQYVRESEHQDRSGIQEFYIQDPFHPDREIYALLSPKERVALVSNCHDTIQRLHEGVVLLQYLGLSDQHRFSGTEGSDSSKEVDNHRRPSQPVARRATVDRGPVFTPDKVSYKANLGDVSKELDILAEQSQFSDGSVGLILPDDIDISDLESPFSRDGLNL